MTKVGNISFALSRIGFDAVIQDKTVIEGDYDGNDFTWNDKLTALVAIEDLSGNELIAAQKLSPKSNHRMYTKELNVAVKDRLFWKNKYLFITYVAEPMNTGDFLEIYLTDDANYDSGSSKGD